MADSALAILLLAVTLFCGGSEGCGSKMYLTLGETLSIRSPNYPLPYHNYMTCYWNVTAPSGHTVGYSFGEDFHIEYSPKCVHDYIKLYIGSYTITACGKAAFLGNITDNRYLIVKFKSDGSKTFKGFKLAVTADTIPPRPSVENRGGMVGIEVTGLVSTLTLVGIIVKMNSG